MQPFMFEHVRRTPFRAILLFIIVNAAAAAAINFVFFPHRVFEPIETATHQIFNESLVVNLLMLIVLAGGVILRFGRLHPADVGLVGGRLKSGVLLTLLVWGTAQLVHLLFGLAETGKVRLDPSWTQNGVATIIGLLIAQIFGNALYEEIAFRGFLLPQLYHHDGRRGDSSARFLVALLVSQVIFALMHIPNRIYRGMTVADMMTDLPLLAVWGVFYALVYLRTDNLFFAVGIHALSNMPTTVFSSSLAQPGDEASALIFILAAVVLLFWPRLEPLFYGRHLPPSPEPASDVLQPEREFEAIRPKKFRPAHAPMTRHKWIRSVSLVPSQPQLEPLSLLYNYDPTHDMLSILFEPVDGLSFYEDVPDWPGVALRYVTGREMAVGVTVLHVTDWLSWLSGEQTIERLAYALVGELEPVITQLSSEE
jgi:CAAX protease family protein